MCPRFGPCEVQLQLAQHALALTRFKSTCSAQGSAHPTTARVGTVAEMLFVFKELYVGHPSCAATRCRHPAAQSHTHTDSSCISGIVLRLTAPRSLGSGLVAMLCPGIVVQTRKQTYHMEKEGKGTHTFFISYPPVNARTQPHTTANTAP